eukprot:3216758-Rhodomonas_salina.2
MLILGGRGVACSSYSETQRGMSLSREATDSEGGRIPARDACLTRGVERCDGGGSSRESYD